MLSDEAMIPSATYIHQQLENRVQFIEEYILDDLPTGAKISLAIDCWSSPHCLAFMAINSYFIDKDWQYHEVLLGFKLLTSIYSSINLAWVLETVLYK